MKIKEALADRTSRKEVIDYVQSFKEIDSDKLGKFLGQGFTHRVYEYGADRHIKVPMQGYIKKQ